jgi:hypothetical protein
MAQPTLARCLVKNAWPCTQQDGTVVAKAYDASRSTRFRVTKMTGPRRALVFKGVISARVTANAVGRAHDCEPSYAQTERFTAMRSPRPNSRQPEEISGPPGDTGGPARPRRAVDLEMAGVRMVRLEPTSHARPGPIRRVEPLRDDALPAVVEREAEKRTTSHLVASSRRGEPVVAVRAAARPRATLFG